LHPTTWYEYQIVIWFAEDQLGTVHNNRLGGILAAAGLHSVSMAMTASGHSERLFLLHSFWGRLISWSAFIFLSSSKRNPKDITTFETPLSRLEA
jgi:hypothetical protein